MLHANYYVSGAVAHTLKHRLGIPMVTTFHTLARAKQEVGIHDDPDDRFEIESAIVRCADGLVVSTEEERELLVDGYDAVAERIEVIPPASTTPCSRRGAPPGCAASGRWATTPCCSSSAGSSPSRASTSRSARSARSTTPGPTS